jgi:ketosteroid isomerase-like protein
MVAITLGSVSGGCGASTAGETPAHAHAVEASSEDVRAAIDNFYVALNEMFAGDITRMREAWSHENDVTYMGPTGGLKVGWAQILEVWEAQAARRLGGSVAATQMQIVVGDDIAVTSNYEVGENTNAAGTVERVNIRVTNTFRRENGIWKMIGHHTDLLPFLSTHDEGNQ